MKISFLYKNRIFKIDVKPCNKIQRFFGLMFRRREKAKALLFDFGKPVNIRIHSFFVFFTFVAIWLDEKNNVLKIEKIRPYSFPIGTKKPFNKLIEIPVNKKYSKILVFF
ncbi:MAG: DUF192 domain-containing protein [Candidatus Pacearchaeota archaeon]